MGFKQIRKKLEKIMPEAKKMIEKKYKAIKLILKDI